MTPPDIERGEDRTLWERLLDLAEKRGAHLVWRNGLDKRYEDALLALIGQENSRVRAAATLEERERIAKWYMDEGWMLRENWRVAAAIRGEPTAAQRCDQAQAAMDQFAEPWEEKP